MDELKLIDVIQMELQALNLSVETAIKFELSTDIDLGHSGKLQFEIDPLYYRIHLTQTENDILESFSLEEDVENMFEDDIYEVVSSQIPTWFADRWQSVNGSNHYSPAYIFFHGGLGARRYDLEKRCWYSVQELWPELNER